MFRIHVLTAAVGVLALVAAASSVQAKQKERALHGVVVKVEMDAAKDSGKITVKTGGKDKKTGVETPAVERTIRVTKATTFAKVAHKPGAAKGEKGSLESTPATFDQLEEGDHVRIEEVGGRAVEVMFHAPHKKK